MTYSPQVQRVMDAEGITPGKLEEMLHSAAITSLDGFNMRYFNWLFRVAGEEVQAMESVDRGTLGAGDTVMYEMHEACDGQGCKACGWSGEIGRRVYDKPRTTLKTGSRGPAR